MEGPEPEPQPMTLNELRAQARQKAREQAVNARELLEHMMAGAAGDDERVAASEAAAHIFSMQPHTRMAQMQVAEPLVLAALEVLTADRLAETIQAEDDDGEGLVDACADAVRSFLDDIFDGESAEVSPLPRGLVAQLEHVVSAAAQDLGYPDQGTLQQLLSSISADGGVPIPGGLLSTSWAALELETQLPTCQWADFEGKEPAQFGDDYPILAANSKGRWISTGDKDDRDDDDYGFFYSTTSMSPPSTSIIAVCPTDRFVVHMSHTERLKEIDGCWGPLSAWLGKMVAARLSDNAIYWAWFRCCLHGGRNRPLAMGDMTGLKIWHCGEQDGMAYGPVGVLQLRAQF
jgi:hypothetical protein